MMLIPILGKLLPVSQVPAALSIGTFSSSASRLLVFHKNISWTIVRYFVPSAVPAVWLGAWLLKFLDPVYIEIGMGIFLLSNLPALIRKPKAPVKEHPPQNITLVIIGFLAGFLSGITGAVGLLFNKFYLRHGLTKEEIVATRAANEIVLHLIKLVLYALFGLLSSDVIVTGVVIAAAAIFSTWMAKYALPYLSERVFKKIGYAAMVISGIFMLQQSAVHLLSTNNGALSTAGIDKGFEARLKWQDVHFALEFTYEDGFEFEQRIPFSDLSQRQQNMVRSRRRDADNIIIEVVHAIGRRSYEAYYFSSRRLVEKYSFD